MQNNEMNKFMERKHIIAYLKNYSFCIHIFLKQLCVFFLLIDLSHYSVYKSIKVRL